MSNGWHIDNNACAGVFAQLRVVILPASWHEIANSHSTLCKCAQNFSSA